MTVKANVILFLFALSSCGSGMYDMLHRSIDDPVIVSPFVESFVQPNTIFVSWDRDEGADEYILERRLDRPWSAWEAVYKGTALEYVDLGLEEDRYIYRMFKRRGNEVFGPSPEVLGVSSLIIRDVYRNDTMEQALHVESDIIASIYYFRSYGGLELIDEDWFYIDIPPLRMASIVVYDLQVPVAETPSHFTYFIHGRESGPVIHMKAFWIENTETVTNRFYFKLFPAKQQFVPSGIPGGKIVQYRLSLTSIIPAGIGG